jgi:serine O-acetyltransferase
MVSQDLYRYTKQKRTFRSLLYCFVSHPGFRFMVFFRSCNRFSKYHPLGLISRLWLKRLSVKFGFQIPHRARIGKGFFLGHYGNIVINQDVRLGENCNVAQGVTIGQVNRGEKQGTPSIGSRVWIGANAVVVGKITIGNDVLIAPLSFVNFDVPDNAVVIGNPAKVVSYEGSKNYINNLDE